MLIGFPWISAHPRRETLGQIDLITIPFTDIVFYSTEGLSIRGAIKIRDRRCQHPERQIRTHARRLLNHLEDPVPLIETLFIPPSAHKPGASLAMIDHYHPIIKTDGHLRQADVVFRDHRQSLERPAEIIGKIAHCAATKRQISVCRDRRSYSRIICEFLSALYKLREVDILTTQLGGKFTHPKTAYACTDQGQIMALYTAR